MRKKAPKMDKDEARMAKELEVKYFYYDDHNEGAFVGNKPPRRFPEGYCAEWNDDERDGFDLSSLERVYFPRTPCVSLAGCCGVAEFDAFEDAVGDLLRVRKKLKLNVGALLEDQMKNGEFNTYLVTLTSRQKTALDFIRTIPGFKEIVGGTSNHGKYRIHVFVYAVN